MKKKRGKKRVCSQPKEENVKRGLLLFFMKIA
jgi:hypothetical protein